MKYLSSFFYLKQAALISYTIAAFSFSFQRLLKSSDQQFSSLMCHAHSPDFLVIISVITVCKILKGKLDIWVFCNDLPIDIYFCVSRHKENTANSSNNDNYKLRSKITLKISLKFEQNVVISLLEKPEALSPCRMKRAKECAGWHWIPVLLGL